ncbi:hypothetical protein B0H21DRAFT_853642 [Amylocystis lapponica]|nr:hypothetical protein B0H21DRAFT_853642 [Amylocystis lapponica]
MQRRSAKSHKSSASGASASSPLSSRPTSSPALPSPASTYLPPPSCLISHLPQPPTSLHTYHPRLHTHLHHVHPSRSRLFRLQGCFSPSSPSKSRAEQDTTPPPSPTLPHTHTGLIVFCPDKENIDPYTGRRSLLDPTTKKRKTTTVLATKSLVPSRNTRKSRSTRSVAPSTSTTVVLAVKSRTPTDKKPKRVSGSRRNGAGPSRVRKEPSLPPVDEAAESEKERDRVVQSQIDSRCYELTVSPLADVSPAYEQVPTFDDQLQVAVKKSVDSTKDSEASTPVERSPSPVSSGKGKDASSVSPVPAQGEDVFSTPQRKRIYSAFTFSPLPLPASATPLRAARTSSSLSSNSPTDHVVTDGQTTARLNASHINVSTIRIYDQQ